MEIKIYELIDIRYDEEADANIIRIRNNEAGEIYEGPIDAIKQYIYNLEDVKREDESRRRFMNSLWMRSPSDI